MLIKLAIATEIIASIVPRLDCIESFEAPRYVVCMKDSAHGCIDIQSVEYPALLKEVPDAPKLLYYRGDWEAGYFLNTVGVVGSRRITFYGERVSQKLVSELVNYNATIVSGFMYGVDYIAHTTAIANGGKTLAVLPCGIDLVMQKEHKALYDSIVNGGGLVLSEFPETFAPKAWTFYKRNRIVAGLSMCLLVIEAGLDSGSLITANYAKKYNRKIYSIPGSIFSEFSLGTLQLIKDGAKAISSGYEIAVDLNLEHNNSPLKLFETNQAYTYDRVFDQTSLEAQILSLLRAGPRTLNEILCQFAESSSFLSSKITLMLLNGSIYERENKFYCA